MFNPCNGHDREAMFWVLADFEHYVKVYGVPFIMSQLTTDVRTMLDSYYLGTQIVKKEVPALLKNAD